MNEQRRKRLREAWLEIEAGARVVHIELQREPQHTVAAHELQHANYLLAMAKNRITDAIRDGHKPKEKTDGT